MFLCCLAAKRLSSLGTIKIWTELCELMFYLSCTYSINFLFVWIALSHKSFITMPISLHSQIQIKLLGVLSYMIWINLFLCEDEINKISKQPNTNHLWSYLSCLEPISTILKAQLIKFLWLCVLWKLSLIVTNS